MLDAGAIGVASAHGAHHQNGGRVVPSLNEFTFKESGVTVRIRKVSPAWVDSIRKAFPAPSPPLNAVDYGDGRVVQEPNAADPGYQRALAQHEDFITQKYLDVLVRLGVECDVDQEALAEARAVATLLGIELDPDDKHAYILHVAARTQEDFGELITALTRRAQPTEEAVAEAVAQFRPDVQGAPAL